MKILIFINAAFPFNSNSTVTVLASILLISLALVVSLFKEGMKQLLGISEKQIQTVVDYTVSALPGYLQRTLLGTVNKLLLILLVFFSDSTTQ